MDDEYTPTTTGIRNMVGDWSGFETLAEGREAFDRWLAAHDAETRRQTLLDAAHKWSWSAWASTPRHRERVADRMGASQYVGDWLRALANGGD